MYKQTTSENKALKWSIYYSPLHPLTWIAAMVTVLFHTIGYKLTTKLTKDEEATKWWWTGFHGFAMQGTPTEPTSVSARIVFWILFVTGWLLWASNSATLASLLVVKSEKPPFVNLYDMLKNTDYKIMFAKGDAGLDLFKVFKSISPHIIVKIAFDSCLLSQTGNSIEREVIQSRTIIAPDDNTFLKELKTNNKIVGYGSASTLRIKVGNSCAFQFIPGWKKASPYGQYIQKNSSYTNLFNYQ